jgi:hypothetical protein
VGAGRSRGGTAERVFLSSPGGVAVDLGAMASAVLLVWVLVLSREAVPSRGPAGTVVAAARAGARVTFGVAGRVVAGRRVAGVR